MIENKRADKITSLGKTKSKGNENERQKTYIPSGKRQQYTDDLRSFSHNHNITNNHKVTNLLDKTSNNVPIFITTKWVEVHDQSGSAEDRYK